jgi:branched-chain amino acid transport system permease protein
MSGSLLLVQTLNGLQLGVMLFLMAAGLTLVFGVMDLVNLAHGSLYMIGAYIAATADRITGSFFLAVCIAVLLTSVIGMLLERVALRPLYRRGHLDQVLATFGLILFCNEAVRMIWGPRPIFLNPPRVLAGTVEILPGVNYPAFRLAILAVGIGTALFLWYLVARTKLGMRIRAGGSNREMVQALGVDVGRLFTRIFGLGAGLAALAGAMTGPILVVQTGMGEAILILTFVVIVIGGIGSIRGAFAAAILVGLVDTFGRVLLPPAVASMSIYLLMAVVLAWRPQGLFPANA